MNGLVFSGAKCNSSIWDDMRGALAPFHLTFVQYPHRLLAAAETVDEIARWAVNRYGQKNRDVLIGHSLGGQVVLRMLPLMKHQPKKVILIESNPLPSGTFYRNLMTAEHMTQYQSKVMSMFQAEAPYYTDKLLHSLGDGYDLLPEIRAYAGSISAIYGDRGQSVSKKHFTELRLPQDIRGRMPIYFVPDACHLPMIENPAALTAVITGILQQ